jgi:hypothetical protein
LSVVKTAISLQETIYKKGKRKADMLFGGNFSGYVGYLISKDGLGIDSCKEELKNNTEVLNSIDSILDI